MKFTAGLVSVSFRGLDTDKIIELTKKNGLSAIEWGGDIHVPAGEMEVARDVGEKTRENRLEVAEYGSYYRIGVSSPDEIDRAAESARALGTDIVRVWAYNKGSLDVTADEYESAVADARRICALYPDLTFCTECHNNTLTDDYNANLRLLEDVDMPNFAAFWQPNQYKSHEYNIESARALAPFVKAVHVFAWEGNEKYPLAHHRDRWVDYLRAFAEHCDDKAFVSLMLEFMHDNDPASLEGAAGTLREILELVKIN